MKKKKIARISTDSIELALEQLIRTRTAKTKASIKPVFVIEALKELIDRRREEAAVFAEVEELFNDDDCEIVVEEVVSLSELGNSSWPSGPNLEEVEWKKPEELDDSDVTHEVLQRPVLRTKRRSGVMGSSGKWQDGYTTRRIIVFTLTIVIALTAISVLAVF